MVTARTAPSRAMRWGVGALVVALVVAGLAIGGGPLLRLTGLRTAGAGASTVPSTLFAPTPAPTRTPAVVAGSGPVGPPAAAGSGSPITGATLTAKVGAIPAKFKGASSWVVLDPSTGAVSAQRNGSALLIPASNMKTLTSVAALSALGRDHTFSTSVVSPKAGSIVLVGGGDPLLGSKANPRRPGAATTAQLAAGTAAALKKAGTTSVTLGYDASLFSGPNWHPSWPAGYSDQITRLSALSVDEGLTLDAKGVQVPGSTRSSDPAKDAATIFAAQLKAQGITVTGTPAAANRGAGSALASVSSLPLSDVVAWTMLHSDNYAAEALFRHVGIAGRQPGSFAGGATAIKATLSGLGLWQNGAVLTDGSGLSRSNRASALMLARTWQHIATQPALASLLTATPVAGVSGTLAGDRFYPDQGAAAGRGWVRAKTGTLTGVSTLSGWTVTQAGSPVVLAIMVNDSDADWWARVWIDQVASTITGCGC